jgi:hypothetical protein
MMNEETTVIEEFKPQFTPGFIETGYRKVSLKYRPKAYIGTFVEHGRVVKFTRKVFKRATEAENYSASVLERYSRILTERVKSV